MCVHNLSGKNHSADGDFVFQLESPVKLHDGKNYISLLSATVGLKVPNFLSWMLTSIVSATNSSSLFAINHVYQW